jgi:hypothetical protein
MRDLSTDGLMIGLIAASLDQPTPGPVAAEEINSVGSNTPQN